MKTVAIAGVGLIGGSFALAIRKAGFSGPILGVSSPRTIAQAIELGVIDEGVSLQQACERADLIYLAQPILRIIQQMTEMSPWVRAGTLVTDAGSTKARIVEAARTHLPHSLFIGGHPMAGKEIRGASAADPDLFAGRPYVLTPIQASDLQQPAAEGFLTLLGAIGARTVLLEPPAHDRLVARTSHLPQVIATALGSLLAEFPDCSQVAGPALTQIARLAQSPFEMWHEIFLTNSKEVEIALDEYIRKLQNVKGQLTSESLRSVFAEAAHATSPLKNNHS